MDSRHEQSNSTPRSTWELLKINLELGIKKSLLVIPTQPMYVTMRLQQKTIALKDNARVVRAIPAFNELAPDAKKMFTQPLQLLRDMHQSGQLAAHGSKYPAATYLQAAVNNHPLRNVYKGFAPGFLKEAIKNGGYKGVVIVKAPDYAEAALSYTPLSKMQFPWMHYTLTMSLAAGMTAITDVILGGALDSWATHASTSQGKDAKASYTQEVSAEKSLTGKIRRAYRGFYPALGRSWLAFGTMYSTAEPIKQHVAAFYGLESHQKPWYATLTSAVVSGLSVAIVSAPAELMKTWRQMPNASDLPALELMSTMYNKFGLRGMMAGVPLKTAMVVMGWGINFAVTQNHKPGHQETKALHHNRSSFYQPPIEASKEPTLDAQIVEYKAPQNR